VVFRVIQIRLSPALAFSSSNAQTALVCSDSCVCVWLHACVCVCEMCVRVRVKKHFSRKILYALLSVISDSHLACLKSRPLGASRYSPTPRDEDCHRCKSPPEHCHGRRNRFLSHPPPFSLHSHRSSLLPPPPHLSITKQVRCIGNGSSNTFATGEQRASSASTTHQRRDCVCVYDASSGPFETLQAQVGLVLCEYVCLRESVSECARESECGSGSSVRLCVYVCVCEGIGERLCVRERECTER